MKKHIFFIVLIIGFPYLFCVIGGMFCERLQLGQGDNRIEHNHLGKDILIEINGLYKTMDVEEYVLGVLPGTISVDYDMEALKVQAILIRTNVLKEMEEKGSADALDLSYQYLSVEERRDLFGARNFERYSNKFERAVVETAGKVLRQEDTLIMAMYHEVSIGKTASATEVLGEEIAYLQSVDSSQDVEAKYYMNVVSYTWEQLQQLENKDNEAVINKETEQVVETTKEEEQGKSQDIQVSEATENGFVKKLSVDGTIYTGEESVERYGLSSMNFYVEKMEDGVRFVCLGKGNCLGISQYGANWMALNGKNAEEIIDHYYKKVSIEDYR